MVPEKMAEEQMALEKWQRKKSTEKQWDQKMLG